MWQTFEFLTTPVGTHKVADIDDLYAIGGLDDNMKGIVLHLSTQEIISLHERLGRMIDRNVKG